MESHLNDNPIDESILDASLGFFNPDPILFNYWTTHPEFSKQF